MHIFDICTNDLQNKNFLSENCRRSCADKPCTLYADRQTDRQGETYIPPNFVCGGIYTVNSYNADHSSPQRRELGKTENDFSFIAASTEREYTHNMRFTHNFSDMLENMHFITHFNFYNERTHAIKNRASHTKLFADP